MSPPAPDRGSVLALMPAVVLVVVILGVICVDSAVEYLGHRQLADFTAGAADNAVAQALDQAAFYRGDIRIDPTLAQAAVDTLRQAMRSAPIRITSAVASVWDLGRAVTVRATAIVDVILGGAVSGHRQAVIHASSTARVHEVRVS